MPKQFPGLRAGKYPESNSLAELRKQSLELRSPQVDFANQSTERGGLLRGHLKLLAEYYLCMCVIKLWLPRKEIPERNR